MTRQEAIYQALEDLHYDDLQTVAYALAERGYLGEDDLWRDLDLSEIMYDVNDADDFRRFLIAARDGDFDPSDDYWRWGCYGIESSNELDYDLDDFAETIDEHADSWIRRELPSEIVEVLDEWDDQPDEDDDTDYPEDTTDYDGVDDPDEDEPSPAAEPPEQEPMRHDALMLEAMRVLIPSASYSCRTAVLAAQQRSFRLLGRDIMTCTELHRLLRDLGYPLIDNP